MDKVVCIRGIKGDDATALAAILSATQGAGVVRVEEKDHPVEMIENLKDAVRYRSVYGGSLQEALKIDHEVVKWNEKVEEKKKAKRLAKLNKN